MTSSPLKHSFAPVWTEHTRLLVLGSLPGEVSLARQRYYAHPQNQFWRLIGSVVGADLVALDYEARLQALLDAGIGLWDVVGSGTRKGSLDTDLRLHHPNDLAALADALPQLQAIGFNGGTAARLGRRLLSARADLALLDLPSSSPAYTLAFERKLESWIGLRDYL